MALFHPFEDGFPWLQVVHHVLHRAFRGAGGDDGDEFEILVGAVEGGVDGALRDEDGGAGADGLLFVLQPLLGLALEDVDDFLFVRVVVEGMASAGRDGGVDEEEVFRRREAG